MLAQQDTRRLTSPHRTKDRAASAAAERADDGARLLGSSR